MVTVQQNSGSEPWFKTILLVSKKFRWVFLARPEVHSGSCLEGRFKFNFPMSPNRGSIDKEAFHKGCLSGREGTWRLLLWGHDPFLLGDLIKKKGLVESKLCCWHYGNAGQRACRKCGEFFKPRCFDLQAVWMASRAEQQIRKFALKACHIANSISGSQMGMRSGLSLSSPTKKSPPP